MICELSEELILLYDNTLKNKKNQVKALEFGGLAQQIISVTYKEYVPYTIWSYPIQILKLYGLA
jgi:hypothetical protein